MRFYLFKLAMSIERLFNPTHWALITNHSPDCISNVYFRYYEWHSWLFLVQVIGNLLWQEVWTRAQHRGMVKTVQIMQDSACARKFAGVFTWLKHIFQNNIICSNLARCSTKCIEELPYTFYLMNNTFSCLNPSQTPWHNEWAEKIY